MNSRKNTYLELAQKAGREERRKDWLEAANLWLGAAKMPMVSILSGVRACSIFAVFNMVFAHTPFQLITFVRKESSPFILLEIMCKK
ncbi:hypothetical protein C1N51_29145 (plasmid) [Vibrio campbellii]|nr:hypothetical protein C1N51_29145 [Vibrio campbellii]